MKTFFIIFVSILISFNCLSNQIDSLLINLNVDKQKELNSVNQNEYIKYCNSRYSFCIEYPTDFIANGESANGDGQRFTSKDGKTIITAYGIMIVDKISTLDLDYEYVKNNKNVIYKKKVKGYFIVSGIDGDKFFYRKTVERNMRYEFMVTYMIEYPIEQKLKYKHYCEKINKSLK